MIYIYIFFFTLLEGVSKMLISSYSGAIELSSCCLPTLVVPGIELGVLYMTDMCSGSLKYVSSSILYYLFLGLYNLWVHG